MNNQDLHRQLLEAFKTEAEERIASMFSNLTDLEKSTDAENRGKMLEIVYREAHSLKGAARSVNIIPIETLCQEIEGLFSKLKDEKVNFTPDLFDTLHSAVGIIEKYLSVPEPERHNFEGTISELAETLSVFKEAENRSQKSQEMNQSKKMAHRLIRENLGTNYEPSGRSRKHLKTFSKPEPAASQNPPNP